MPRTGHHDGHHDLRRAIARLDRLDDAVVHTASGPVLLDIAGVRDPAGLLAACRRGVLDLADLRDGLELRREPRLLHATWLARVHRDLKAVELSPQLRALVLDAPRSLRRAVTRGPEWLRSRQLRLDVLRLALVTEAGAELGPHADSDGPDLTAIAARSPWLARALDLAAVMHGPASARLALDLLRRSMSHGTSHGRDARRQVELLLRRLAGHQPAPLAQRRAFELALDDLVRDALAPASPRLRVRLLRQAVLAALSWPAAAPAVDPAPAIEIPPPPAGPASSDMSYVPSRDTLAGLRHYAAAAAGQLHAALDRPALLELDLALAHAALAFPIDPGLPAWGRAELRLAARLVRLRAELTGPGLRLADALRLARLDLPTGRRCALARLVVAGLPLADVDAVIACGRLDALLEIGDLADARRFCFWVTRLVPHFKQLGVDLQLEARHLAAMPSGRRRGDLGLLAHCLVQHERRPTPATLERDLALLDTTLGLFRGLPHAAHALLERLGAAPAGLGRTLHPEFAAWLGDDDLLDRSCHLRQLLGEPTTLSHTLRSDFEAGDRLLRQVEHLRLLPAPTPAQSQRRIDLEARLERGDLPGPAWTRRRLAEQADELRVRAFRQQLDAALCEVLRAAFAIDIPALTPAWRDVVRFYLGGDWTGRGAERNRQLLGDLLRAARDRPGRPLCRTWPKNQAWIDRARARFDVDAWLRQRAQVCQIGARTCTLAVEDDPLEVLRMGVPFDTCLSLRDGFNASSAVLNAVDVNKRVLYLRGDDGAILARQLLAVSADLRLLRYRLYASLDPADSPAITCLFDNVYRDIVKETCIVETDEGAPEALHGGFWYDDGPLAAGADHDSDVAELLAAYQLPPSPGLEPWQRQQLRGPVALRRGDAAAALVLACQHAEPLRSALARLAVAGLGEPACRARAARDPAARRTLVIHALASDGDPASRLLLALARARGLPADDQIARVLYGADERLPPTGALARAWLTAAEQLLARGATSDHGIAHAAFHTTRHFAALPLAELLPLADRLAAHWDRYIAATGDCHDCRDSAQYALDFAALAAYRRLPDPRLVLRTLAAATSPSASVRLALAIAAHYPLVNHNMSLETCGEHNLGTAAVADALARLERPPVPCPAAMRALASLARRCPALARTPAFIAACVRHHDPRRLLVLPDPEASPLPQCAELVLHASDLLARFAEPEVPPSEWQPRRWELALHRRVPSRWRRRLRRAAAAGDPNASKWADALGELQSTDPDAPAAPLAAITARLIRGESVDFAELARALNHRSTAQRVGPTLDPTVLLAFARTFRATLAGAAPLADGLRALQLWLLADDDHQLPLALIAELLAAPRRPELAALAGRLLDSVRRYALLTGPQLAALWTYPGARPQLAAFLARQHRYHFPATLTTLADALRDDHATLHALLTAWFAAQAEADAWANDFTCPPELLPLVVRAALDGAGPSALLQLYDHAPLLTQLELTRVIADLSPTTIAALRDHLAADTDTDTDTEPDIARVWLAHTLARLTGADADY